MAKFAPSDKAPAKATPGLCKKASTWKPTPTKKSRAPPAAVSPASPSPYINRRVASLPPSQTTQSIVENHYFTYSRGASSQSSTPNAINNRGHYGVHAGLNLATEYGGHGGGHYEQSYNNDAGVDTGEDGVDEVNEVDENAEDSGEEEVRDEIKDDLASMSHRELAQFASDLIITFTHSELLKVVRFMADTKHEVTGIGNKNNKGNKDGSQGESGKFAPGHHESYSSNSTFNNMSEMTSNSKRKLPRKSDQGSTPFNTTNLTITTNNKAAASLSTSNNHTSSPPNPYPKDKDKDEWETNDAFEHDNASNSTSNDMYDATSNSELEKGSPGSDIDHDQRENKIDHNIIAATVTKCVKAEIWNNKDLYGDLENLKPTKLPKFQTKHKGTIRFLIFDPTCGQIRMVCTVCKRVIRSDIAYHHCWKGTCMNLGPRVEIEAQRTSFKNAAETVKKVSGSIETIDNSDQGTSSPFTTDCEDNARYRAKIAVDECIAKNVNCLSTIDAIKNPAFKRATAANYVKAEIWNNKDLYGDPENLKVTKLPEVHAPMRGRCRFLIFDPSWKEIWFLCTVCKQVRTQAEKCCRTCDKRSGNSKGIDVKKIAKTYEDAFKTIERVDRDWKHRDRKRNNTDSDSYDLDSKRRREDIAGMGKDEVWEYRFRQLVEYSDVHGHANINSGLGRLVLKGLGRWVLNQRLEYKKGQLRQDRIDRLNMLCFKWD